MAGLLDYFSSEEAAPALMMLAAGGGNLGGVARGLLDSQMMMQDRKDKKSQRELQTRLGNAQLANYQSEIDNRALAARKDARQQEMMSSFLGGAPSAVAGGSVQGGGAPGGDAQSPGGAGNIGPQGILALAQQYGIPPQAIQADIAFNGGKNISELLAKHGGRDMQVSNGYVFDKNRMGPGFLPSLQTSQDGKSTMTRIGPDGLPIVSAPQGALETFRGYQSAQADYKPIKVFNPATGREEYRSEGQVVGGAPTTPAPLRAQTQPGVTGAGYNGGDRDLANRESIQIIQAEMNRATRPEDKAALGREIMRLQQQSGLPQGTPMQPQSGAYAAGPSLAEQNQAKADEARMVGQAKADVQATDQRASAISGARDMLSVIDSLQQHPGRATSTGLSGVLDPRNYIPGTDAKDFRVALDQLQGKTFLQAFENLKGGGQITEVEGKKASDAIARLNTSQSDAAFNKALGDLKQVVTGSLARQEASAQRGGVQAGQPASAPRQLLSTLPPANASNKGQRIRDTTTGKILKSNGMQWTEE